MIRSSLPTLFAGLLGPLLAVLGSVATPITSRAQELAWPPSDQADRDWVVDWWGTGNGLPQATVSALVQTSDGYLWVGTFGGLARFDGVRFQIFDAASTPGLDGNRVTALFEDSRGILWVGAEDSGIALRNPDGSFEALENPQGLTVTPVSAIAEDAEGNIWFAAGQRFLVFSEADGLRESNITLPSRTRGKPSLTFDNGLIWLGLGGTRRILGLAPGEGASFTVVDSIITTGSDPFLLRDSTGFLWIGTSLGLEYPGDAGSRTIPWGWPGNIAAMMQGPGGRIWLVGADVRVIDPETTPPTVGGVAASLQPLGPGPLPYVNRGLIDREGNVWLGVHRVGLVRLRPRPFSFFAIERTEGVDVWGITADQDGTILVSVGCGATGGIMELRGGRFFELTPPGRDLCETPVATTRDGAILLAERSGLSRSRDQRTENVDARSFQRLAPATGGDVWAVSTRGLSKYSGDSLTLIAAAPPDREMPLGALIAGAGGAAWMGGGGRLARWDGESLTWIRVGEGVGGGHIRALFEDEDGILWIGTYGGGLWRLEQEDLTHYTVADGLADNFVLQILEDDHGNLWLNGNRSISYVSRLELNRFARAEIERVEPVAFGSADGFVEGNSGQHGAWKSADGKMWFSTIDGVLMVDGRNRVNNPLPPPVTIETFTAGDSTYDLRQAIEVAPRTQNFQVVYTALSLRRPDRLRFRYKLEGYDDDWVDASDRRSAFYSGIPPGRYLFRVVASNDEGIWNETGASMALVVAPSFWVTWWFRLMAALVLSWVAYTWYMGRTRAIRQHASELQSQIDERERLEGRQRALEEQLRQSQKLEAVGQLTGGVAHDFNNLLTVVMGNLELAAGNKNDPETQAAIGGAMQAAGRGAALTQRLLAFSRKQPLRPVSLDVRHLITGMDDLLRRTLGEQIDIETVGAGGLWRCEADPTQLENAILNLAINARDAMPRGGKLTLEVGNVRLDSGYADLHVDVEAGQYVMVAVTDSGTGMPPDVIERAFDPFFTTKGVGRGSGLGLSMVYGFARQSGGHAKIYSEPGDGTTVKIYLPRSHSGIPTPEPMVARDRAHSGGNELVLVVEDDAPVRRITVSLLRRLGYRTVEAATIADALDRLETEPEVALLFTDVVLEGGETGADLARKVNRLRPDIPVLFTSGYTENAIVHHGRLDPGVDLLEKPFTKEQLGSRVQDAINRARD